MTRFGLQLFGAALALCSVSLASAQTIQIDKNNRTLAITVTDSAKAMADVAILHVGYTVYAPTSDSVYAMASKTSNAIADALAAAGIEKKALQSESQSVSETPSNVLFDWTPQEREDRRYRAEQSWTVRLKADNAARVLNIAVQAGANDSGAIDWTVDDEHALEEQAAAKALLQDRQIAASMAKGLGASVGPLLYASNQAATEGGVRGVVMGGIYRAQKAVAPLSINPREVERSATVYAVFAIQ